MREAGQRGGREGEGSRQASAPLTPGREKKGEGAVIYEAPREAEPFPDLPSK